jgi:hypothetical protein
VKEGITCTVAGWYWYCDVHDTHGNADSKDEALHMAQAHSDWHYDDMDNPEECDGAVIEVAPVERLDVRKK